MTKEKLNVQILRPFGPRILHVNMPKKYVNSLNKECDAIISNKQRRKESDQSSNLVGHVKEELTCDLSNPKLKEFGSFLCDATKCLYNEFLKERSSTNETRPEELDIHSSWFVRSFEGDYNPTHFHNDCSFSCVAYLKVPEGISTTNTRNVKEKYTTEGYIDFIYGSSGVVTAGNIGIMPIVGDIFIFPSYLFHTVYPFYGEGERRSFSANMSLSIR